MELVKFANSFVPIIDHFGFSRYIESIMHLDIKNNIYLRCIVKSMYYNLEWREYMACSLAVTITSTRHASSVN